MASKFQCICGEVINTNLYSGNGVKIVIPEEYTDVDDKNKNFDLTEFIDKIVIESPILVECIKCKRIAIIDNDYKIKIYEPVKEYDDKM